MRLHLQCYSGRKADETPLRFQLNTHEYFVEEVFDQWCGMATPDLLLRRQTNFVLWRPSALSNPPVLIIGIFAAGNPNTLANPKSIPLSIVGPGAPGLWTLPVADSGLSDGIYHYWFQIENTNPGDPAGVPILCTDPFATAVDWRLLSADLPAGFNNATDRQPAAVIQLQNGRLLPMDPA